MSGRRRGPPPPAGRRGIAFDPCGSQHADAVTFHPDEADDFDGFAEDELPEPEPAGYVTDLVDPCGWTPAEVERRYYPGKPGVPGLDARLMAPARSLPPPSPSALVFAYGSNLLAAQMASRVPGSEPVGAAVLAHHRLDFVGWSGSWGGGVATVSPRDVTAGGTVGPVPPDPSRVPSVSGLLWRLPVGGLDLLDGFEGHPTVYRRERLPVAMTSGTVLAWVYRHQRPILAPPSKAYRDTILTGARAFKLPTAHVAEAATRARKLKGQFVLG